MQHIQVLALVLVDALDLHIEDGIRVDGHAGALADERGQRALVGALDLAPLGAKVRVLGQRLEPAQLARDLDPAVADGARDELRQARIGQHHPAARRHAVGLVAEFLRPQLVEIAQHVALEQFACAGRRRH